MDKTQSDFVPSDAEVDPPSDSELDPPSDSELDPPSDSELDIEVDKDMFEPLYPGASISKCGAYCAIMEFKRVCRLPFTAIAMLLQLLQLLCPVQNKLPRSIYMLKKVFQRHRAPYTKRVFCSSCNKEICQGQKRCMDRNCTYQEPNALIHLPSDRAVQRIVTSHSTLFYQCIVFYMSTYTYMFIILHFVCIVGNWTKLSYPQRECNPHIQFDIHTGKGYRKDAEFYSHTEHIGAFFNTDGISVFKSSRLTVWPIFLALASLPPSIHMNKENIITVALWVGHCKPQMEIFLPVLTKELDRLNTTGVSVRTSFGHTTIRMKPLFGVFDLIAKAPVINMKQFNGKHGCPSCLHPGTRLHTQVYPPGTYHKRSNASINRDAGEAENAGTAVNGIKGRSILFGFVELPIAIPIDYMHCVLEGVTKWLLETWVASTSHGFAYYLGRHVKQVDSELLCQRPPHEFSRAPRTIVQHRKFWKASEFRNWMLFYSLPLLLNVLPPLYVHHYALLVCAMHILLQEQLSDSKIQAAEAMLMDFYKLLPELYGKRSCTLNARTP